MATNSSRGGTLTAYANGARLKQLRGNRKQSEIEDACGIPHGQLTRFETGKPVSITNLLTLAGFYQVEPASLLSEEGLKTTGELLALLAKLRGVTVNFASSSPIPPMSQVSSGSSESMVL